MTKAEQNDIIKSKLMEHLQTENSIPTDIGETYRNWLVNKINEASLQLMQQGIQQEDMSEGA